MYRVLTLLYLFGITNNKDLHYFQQQRSDEKRHKRQIALEKQWNHSSAFIHLPKGTEVHLVLTQRTMSSQKTVLALPGFGH